MVFLLYLPLVSLLTTSSYPCRIYRLKCANKPLSSFFNINSSYGNATTASRSRTFPRTIGLPSLHPDALYRTPYDTHLAPLPVAYTRRSRRTRAADINNHGHRLGGGEYDEEGDKDALPAYDIVGGPPKYTELEMRTRLFGLGGALRPVEFNQRLEERMNVLEYEQSQRPTRDDQAQGDASHPGDGLLPPNRNLQQFAT